MSFRMPAEWESHERTLMAWPTHPSWGNHLDDTRVTCVRWVNAMAEFEPLTMFENTGLVLVGTGGSAADDQALEVVREAFPGRSAVAVPAKLVFYAGGGPHCPTMQIPSEGGVR